jgi:phosphatidylinositol glycan class H protein
MGTKCTFQARRLSAALIEYEVSEKPTDRSLPRLCVDICFLVVKLVLVLVNLLSFLSVLPVEVPTSIVWLFRGCSSIVLLIRRYRKESLLVLQSFGLQVSSQGRFYLGGYTRFIPKSDIVDIVIQESFIGFEIRHVLVIMLRHEGQLQVVFSRILPRLDVVEQVWRGARECLHEGDPSGKATEM